MDIKTVTACFFSPGGTTQKITTAVAQAFGKEVRTVDLLRYPLAAPLEVAAGNLLVVGMPVYAGRIPAVCTRQLRRLSGSGSPAVALAVYGNRAFEDALLELQDLLCERGFYVPAAGAFVAQHSIFGKVAAGRPDGDDMDQVRLFVNGCKETLARYCADGLPPVKVPGNRPYRQPSAVPLKPSASGKCTGCGVCARLCPTGSIPAENPLQTNKESCISCAACIHNCPAGARAFRGVAFQAAELVFTQKNSKRKQPEAFFAE